MKKKAIILSFILFLFYVSISQAQTSNSKFDSNKLVFGGDLSFAISDDHWGIGLAPQVGYRFTNKIIAGAGLGYRYLKQDITFFKASENTASFNLFGYFLPWKALVVSAKPEIMHTWYKSKYRSGSEYSQNEFIPTLIVGAGVYLKPVMIQLNYDLIQDDYSPYRGGIFLSLGVLF